MTARTKDVNSLGRSVPVTQQSVTITNIELYFTTGTTADLSLSHVNAVPPGTTTVVPGLAESWTSSDNGTVFTFKLRHGVKWQSNANFKPTRDFNADDVLRHRSVS